MLFQREGTFSSISTVSLVFTGEISLMGGKGRYWENCCWVYSGGIFAYASQTVKLLVELLGLSRNLLFYVV